MDGRCGRAHIGVEEMNSLLRELRLADWLLAATLLVAGAMATWASLCTEGGTRAIIHVQGRRVAELLLDNDQKISVTGSVGTVMIEVKAGGVYVRETECSQKRCVAMSPARRRGDLILCVPGEILITIQGDAADGVDGVTG